MKKALILFIFFLVLSISSYSQKLIRTYWDWRNADIKEEYYVNGAGEKNGAYKKYSNNGILEISGNMSRGYWNGQVITYATSSGRQEIVSKETYVNGVKEGPATYYNGKGYPNRQGNFKNDLEEGEWILISFFKDSYDFSEEEQKSYSYVKYNLTYKAGEAIYNGKVSYYFYPTNKIAYIENYEKGNKLDHEGYWPNGQLHYRETIGVSYEKYDQNGQLIESMDRAKARAEQERQEKERIAAAQEKRKAIEKLDATNLNLGDSAFRLGNYDLALNYYYQLKSEEFRSLFEDMNDIVLKEELKDSYHYIIINDNEGALKSYSTLRERLGLNERLGILIDETISRLSEKKKMNNEIIVKINMYYNAYVEIKNTIYVDAQNHRITKEKYLHGEDLYKKSRMVIDSYYDSFRNTNGTELLKTKSDGIKKACDRMIEISSGETKQLNKQLKSIEKIEDIQQILGI